MVLIAPIALAALISAGAQLLGNIFNWFGARQAEGQAKQSTDAMRAIAQRALGSIGSSPNAAIRNQVKAASDIVSGRIAASGLTGSNIGSAVLSDVASRAVSQITPAWWNAMLGATRLAMTPEEMLFNMYSGAANKASGSMGFDFSFLPWLLNMGSGNSLTGGGAGGYINPTFTP